MTSSPGFLVVLSAPSGTGKTTLCGMLMDRDPLLCYSVSSTTRQPRPREVAGKDYDFLSVKAFEEAIAEEEFLEWARYENHLYGTPRKAVMDHLAQGRSVLLTIDVQGLRQLKPNLPGQLVSILMLPPSLEALRQRLAGRRTESGEVLEGRLRRAKEEIESWQEYDYCVVNDDLEQTVRVIRHILDAERHRSHRQTERVNGIAGPETLPGGMDHG